MRDAACSRVSKTELAFEMVICATRQRLADRRARDHLSPRAGRAKLRPFTVGSRQLRLIRTCGPTALFITPGAALALVGAVAIGMVVLDVPAFDRPLFIHMELLGSAHVLVGAPAHRARPPCPPLSVQPN
jgi:hypothetical protein